MTLYRILGVLTIGGFVVMLGGCTIGLFVADNPQLAYIFEVAKPITLTAFFVFAGSLIIGTFLWGISWIFSND
jgi:hypothetical protein